MKAYAKLLILTWCFNFWVRHKKIQLSQGWAKGIITCPWLCRHLVCHCLGILEYLARVEWESFPVTKPLCSPGSLSAMIDHYQILTEFATEESTLRPCLSRRCRMQNAFHVGFNFSPSLPLADEWFWMAIPRVYLSGLVWFHVNDVMKSLILPEKSSLFRLLCQIFLLLACGLHIGFPMAWRKPPGRNAMGGRDFLNPECSSSGNICSLAMNVPVTVLAFVLSSSSHCP